MFKKGDTVTIIARWAKYIFVNVKIQDVFTKNGETYYNVWRFNTANELGIYWTTEQYRASSVYNNAEEAFDALKEAFNKEGLKLTYPDDIADPSESIDEFPPVPEEDIPE